MTVVRNGEELDQGKKLCELEIKDNEILMMYGVVGADAMLKGGKMRWWQRFTDIRNSTWSVSHNRWDGIVFKPTRDIKVFGMGIFERHPNGGPFKMGYKYVLKDSNGSIVESSPSFTEDMNPSPEDV